MSEAKTKTAGLAIFVFVISSLTYKSDCDHLTSAPQNHGAEKARLRRETMAAAGHRSSLTDPVYETEAMHVADVLRTLSKFFDRTQITLVAAQGKFSECRKQEKIALLQQMLLLQCVTPQAVTQPSQMSMATRGFIVVPQLYEIDDLQSQKIFEEASKIDFDSYVVLLRKWKTPPKLTPERKLAQRRNEGYSNKMNTTNIQLEAKGKLGRKFSPFPEIAREDISQNVRASLPNEEIRRKKMSDQSSLPNRTSEGFLGKEKHDLAPEIEAKLNLSIHGSLKQKIPLVLAEDDTENKEIQPKNELDNDTSRADSRELTGNHAKISNPSFQSGNFKLQQQTTQSYPAKLHGTTSTLNTLLYDRSPPSLKGFKVTTYKIKEQTLSGNKISLPSWTGFSFTPGWKRIQQDVQVDMEFEEQMEAKFGKPWKNLPDFDGEVHYFLAEYSENHLVVKEVWGIKEGLPLAVWVGFLPINVHSSRKISRQWISNFLKADYGRQRLQEADILGSLRRQKKLPENNRENGAERENSVNEAKKGVLNLMNFDGILNLSVQTEEMKFLPKEKHIQTEERLLKKNDVSEVILMPVNSRFLQGKRFADTEDLLKNKSLVGDSLFIETETNVEHKDSSEVSIQDSKFLQDESMKDKFTFSQELPLPYYDKNKTDSDSLMLMKNEPENTDSEDSYEVLRGGEDDKPFEQTAMNFEKHSTISPSRSKTTLLQIDSLKKRENILSTNSQETGTSHGEKEAIKSSLTTNQSFSLQAFLALHEKIVITSPDVRSRDFIVQSKKMPLEKTKGKTIQNPSFKRRLTPENNVSKVGKINSACNESLEYCKAPGTVTRAEECTACDQTHAQGTMKLGENELPAYEERYTNSRAPSHLRGNIIRVAVLQNAPLVFLSEDEEGNVLELAGFLPDLWYLLEQELHFRTKWIIPQDRLFAAQNTDGSWSGIVGLLNNKTADVGLAGFSQTTERQAAMAASPAILVDSAGLLVAKSRRYAFYWRTFTEAFSRPVWMSLIALWLLVSAVLYFVTRREASFLSISFVLLGSFAQQGSEIVPTTFHGRLVYACAWMCCVVLYTSYLSRFTTVLTLRSDPTDLSSLEAVVKAGYRITSVQGTILDHYLRTTPKFSNVVEKYPPKLVKDFDEGMQFVKEKNGALVFDSIPLQFASRTNCSMQHHSYSLFSDSQHLGYRKRSPFTRPLDTIIRKLISSGSIDRLWQQWSHLGTLDQDSESGNNEKFSERDLQAEVELQDGEILKNTSFGNSSKSVKNLKNSSVVSQVSERSPKAENLERKVEPTNIGKSLFINDVQNYFPFMYRKNTQTANTGVSVNFKGTKPGTVTMETISLKTGTLDDDAKENLPQISARSQVVDKSIPEVNATGILDTNVQNNNSLNVDEKMRGRKSSFLSGIGYAGSCSYSESDGFEALGFDKTISAFALFLVGITASLLILLCEKIKKCQNRKPEKPILLNSEKNFSESKHSNPSLCVEEYVSRRGTEKARKNGANRENDISFGVKAKVVLENQ